MKRAFDTLLIANRGEIAVRVIRAARELGLKTDEAVHIGPTQVMKSYLNIDAILTAAKAAGAGAVHPGYGFLSENAAFAEAVEAAGMVFVGPSAEAIRTMGDKAAARAAAERAGVRTVPGSVGVVESVDEAVQVAGEIGYPIMIKASAGGGGRGIRVAGDEAELRLQITMAQAEAKAAFGNGAVYLERFIRRARHIEVQILGDGSEVLHCFERECSLQRRRQKIWEEAPSPAIDARTREALCNAAVKLARAVSYRGAGTLEFLYDDDSREFFFIEMNTRIQVEHPITEMVTGIDLVKEMLRVALGEPLRFKQSDIRLHGASIEVRINAENPAKNFMPCPGTVTSLRVPGGPGVRFDSLLFPGCVVSPFYDSLLGKLIVHDEDREAALARLDRALRELLIDGLTTTQNLHQKLVTEPDVRAGQFDTGFLEAWLAANPL